MAGLCPCPPPTMRDSGRVDDARELLRAEAADDL
jgi:hypothetical protein